MTEIKVESVIPMSEPEYWKLLYTTKFDAFYAKAIGLKSTEEVESWTEGQTVVRKVKVVPGVDLPGALLWYLDQDELHYYDTQWKDHEKREVRFQTIPPIYEDILHFNGRIYLEPIDSESCRQILTVTVRVDAWGVGGLIESAVASELQSKFELAPQAVEAWKEYQRKQQEEGEVEEQDEKQNGDSEINGTQKNGVTNHYEENGNFDRDDNTETDEKKDNTKEKNENEENSEKLENENQQEQTS
eukprot:gb/GECH01013326.1/.p1 GENE.gb/GECH01013326.1/~~gb/GECH01013326.1/.p1  ORF type:complete len:244 (+),score=84.63 gb/GECH01013326.1/:1-732(+)